MPGAAALAALADASLPAAPPQAAPAAPPPMGSAGQRRLALALYRATLAFARANADVPFSLRGSDVHRLAPSLRGAAVALQDAGAILPIARAGFDACRHATGAEAQVGGGRGGQGSAFWRWERPTLLAEGGWRRLAPGGGASPPR